MDKTDVYDYVTERIIARLEQGEVPWINTRTKRCCMLGALLPAKYTTASTRSYFQ